MSASLVTYTRVKILILPQKEHVCIIERANNSIEHLRQSLYECLMQYPLYQTLLSECNIIIELRTNGDDFAISSSYLIKEIFNESDIIIAKLVPKSDCTLYKIQPNALKLSDDDEEDRDDDENNESKSSQLDNDENKDTFNQTSTPMKPIQPHSKSKQDDDEQRKRQRMELLNELSNSDIFTLMHKFNYCQPTHHDTFKHKAILSEFRSFAEQWFKANDDEDHILLDQLFATLQSKFPKKSDFLIHSYHITPSLSWQFGLSLELGINDIVDPHITFSLDTNHSNYSFQWRNYLTFDDGNLNILMSEISHRFVEDINGWHRYGFSALTNKYFESSKTEWQTLNIRTWNGLNLVKHPQWTHLIKDLRNAKLMNYGYDSKVKALKLIKSKRFKDTVQLDEQDGYSIDIKKWLRFCLEQKLLPTVLLKTWITESNQAFMTKKEYNKFIAEIGEMPMSNLELWRKEKCECDGLSVSDDLTVQCPFYWNACLKFNKYLEKYEDKLNVNLCDCIIELSANDSVQSFQSRVIEAANKFEENIADKFKLIIRSINNTLVEDERQKIIILDQAQQSDFWSMLKNKYMYGASKAQRGTPDILLSEPVIINGRAVHWLDAKHFFISPSAKLMFKKFLQSVIKYTQAFGTGAIVCNGFEAGASEYHTIKDCNVLLLDGSRDLSVY